jgi:hypothetical protein
MSTNPWDHFWLRTVPPHALALTRIALGLYLLVYAGLYVPNISMVFSKEGLVFPLYFDPPSVLSSIIIYWTFLACIIGLTLGAFYRISVFGTITIALYLWQLQLHGFPTSYNRILLFCLLVLLFSGAQRTLSFDQWRRSGSIWHWEPVSILPQRLIALQITVTFLGVSLQKWWLPHWKGGEILAYSYISRWSTPLSRWYARLPLTLVHYGFIVWTVKIFQPLCAIGIWFPRFRLLSFCFLSSFLILIGAMLSIWWFVFVIPAFILFYSPEDVFLWCRVRSASRIPEKPVKHTK